MDADKALQSLRTTKVVLEAYSVGSESQFFEGYLEVKDIAQHSLIYHTYPFGAK